MRMILSAALVVSMALAVANAGEQGESGERQVALVIEAGTLANALDQWAQQTGFKLLSPNWDVAKQLVAPALKGTFTPRRALEQLLEGTPLVYEVTSERTVTVRARFTAASRTAENGHRVDVPRLQSAPLGAEQDGNSRITPNNASRSKDARTSVSPNTSSEDHDVEELEEIVVTGTHIRGSSNTTNRVIVLDRQYIDASGAGTTTALIQSLPQNFSLENQSGVNVPGTTTSGEQGAGVNLRGIGPGTTLVLLNGRRMAPGFQGSSVDISALPLSAIKRVEILTDGASAIYGSDAIGGVVNFILRDDFEGAETRLRAGQASGGVDEYRISQAFGHAWATGNAVASLEFYKRNLLAAGKRDFVPSSALIGSLLPQDKNYSGMFSGRQALSASVDIFADALYSKRDSFNQGGSRISDQNYTIENPQTTTTLGFNWRLGKNWNVEVYGSYAENDLSSTSRNDDYPPEFGGAIAADSTFLGRSAQVKADGPLFSITGGNVSAAIGASYRSESYKNVSRFVTGPTNVNQTGRQTVRSLFGEVVAPVVGEQNALPGAHGLEVSFAGRLDDYSGFGSSFDPRIGLSWEPVRGLRLRSTYGTSYKAPALSQYTLAGNSAVAFFGPDADSSTGQSHILQVSGTDFEGFSAQKSRNFSFGADFTPESLSGLRLAASYYSIRYRDRIAAPPESSVILGNPQSFGGLFVRNPSVDLVNQSIAAGNLGAGFFPFDEDFNEVPIQDFDPSTIEVIADVRMRNLSSTEAEGIDGSLQYDLRLGDSALHLGVDGTYILKLEQQVTSTSSPFDTVNTFNNPPHTRLRGAIGWDRKGWAANVFINYSGSYDDNRVPTAVVSIGDYITVDTRLSFDFDRSPLTALSGVVISVTAQNLLDQDPPRTAVIDDFSDMGFDPTNASPLGRLVALEIQKQF